ncbi:MAG: hypothetical protein HYR85_17560 [Planctomycetes bacterium]|nr:hypothetical protein [Planctomycetota bacterium]MBI3845261.1 hypothetical protein [Planctomycetota bacterium]
MKRLRLSLALLAAFVVTAGGSAAHAQVIFDDEFNGFDVDSTQWDVDHATSGMRWCSSDLSSSGNWIDPAVTPCHGVGGSSPYGALSVSAGEACFIDGGARAFPYLWHGPPSMPSPFPESADFVLEVGLRYDPLSSVNLNGDGLRAVRWTNTDPVGDNPPAPAGQDVFDVWGDALGLRTVLFGQVFWVNAASASHTYRLDCTRGEYSVHVDGLPALGPVVAVVRPNTIWIGNPIFASSNTAPWSSCHVDFVRVTVSCDAGNVNAGAGSLADVLSVNGSSAQIRVPVGTPFDLTLAASPAGPGDPGHPVARYSLWGWAGSVWSPQALALNGTTVGCVVNPTPLQQGLAPQPIRCFRGQGVPVSACRGVREVNSPPAAPWTLTVPGIRRPITVTLQGVLRDNGAANPTGFSVTNAIVLIVE